MFSSAVHGEKPSQDPQLWSKFTLQEIHVSGVFLKVES